MLITVTRKWSSSLSLMGEVVIDTDAQYRAFSIEPPFRTDDVKPRAISAGTYVLGYRFSPKHNMNVPCVENVPGFEDIEIHPGNFPKDTLGCLLVGLSRGIDFVGDSRKAFIPLCAEVQQCFLMKTPMSITYINSF